jgi:prepilin-type N-terminal cleavage/methylation domain-containing protein
MMYPTPSSLQEKTCDTRPQMYRKGFTLVEILIVIVIIGILAGSLLLIMGTARDNAEAARIISEMRTMKSAAVLYKSDYGAWPFWIYDSGENAYTAFVLRENGSPVPDQDGVLPGKYTDRIPANDGYWINVVHEENRESGEDQASIILVCKGLERSVKEVLASKAKEMGFMTDKSEGHTFQDVGLYTAEDDGLAWFLTGF